MRSADRPRRSGLVGPAFAVLLLLGSSALVLPAPGRAAPEPAAPAPLGPIGAAVVAGMHGTSVGVRPAAGALATQYTLFLGNDSLLRGDVATTPPRDPLYAAYDPGTGLTYASDSSSTLWEVDPSRGIIVGELNAHTSVGNLFVLPSNGDLVLDSSGSVAVLDPTTDTIVTTVSVGNASSGSDGTFAYDPTTNDVWVTNQFASSLEVVNLTSDSVVANIHVGGGFNDILSGVYDPKNGNVYLDYYENEEVEVLNGQTMAFVANVSLTSSYCCFSYGLTVDPVSGNVYVGAGLYGFWSYLVEIAGSNNTVVGSTGFGAYLSNGVYDPNTGDLFVADASRSRLYAFDPANNSLVGSIGLPHENAYLYTQWWPAAAGPLEQIYVPTDYSGTLDIADPSNLTNATSVASLPSPAAMTYDGACGCDVVADSAGNGLYFVDPGTLHIVGRSALAGDPYGIAYDNASGDLWVTLGGFTGTAGVEVLNGTNGSEVALLSDGSTPWGIAYDPVDDRIYVADYFGDDIRVFDAANRTQVTVIPAGNQTTGIAYVPSDHSVYATNWNSHNLTVVNASSDTVSGSVHIGGAPVPIGYDAKENLLFVGNYANSNTTVVNVSQNNVTGSVPVNFTNGFAFDRSTGTAFLLNETSDITVVNGTTLATSRVPAGLDTDTGVWTPEGGLLAGDPETGALYEVNTTAPSLVSNLALLASPERAATYGSLRLTTISVGGPGNLSYQYSGLPPGCLSRNASSLVCNPQTSGRYEVHSTVTYPGAPPATVSATVWVQPAFSVEFEVSGLPPNAVWHLNVTGSPSFISNGTILSMPLPNGTYFAAATSAGFGPARVSFQVLGTPVTVRLRFASATMTLAESGLPAATGWWANVSGRGEFAFPGPGGTTIAVPNGAYTISFGTSAPGWNAPSQRVTVAGSAVDVTAQFAEATYSVVISESGLPAGTAWRLVVTNRVPVVLSSPAVRLPFANGSYLVSASVPAGGWSTPAGGFIVAGANATDTLEFTPVLYAHSFRETGLPSGADWSVTFHPGTTLGSAAALLTAWTATGSYSFKVGGPAGWAPTPANGTFTANSASGTTNVSFVPVSTVPAPRLLGLVATPAAVVLGENLSLIASVGDGVAPLRFVYSGLPTGCESSDASALTCTPSATGSGQVTVSVTDALGRSSNATAAYAVVAPAAPSLPSSPPAPGTPLGPLLAYSALGVVVGLAALLLLGLARRRRGGGTPSPPPPVEEPSEATVGETPPSEGAAGLGPASDGDDPSSAG
ncbi:MAG TPA: hypothetical protein VN864_04360 [Thermoplasmata archaeon]|nr:hypothetical protein [Thermoplasmata archaeon]